MRPAFPLRGRRQWRNRGPKTVSCLRAIAKYIWGLFTCVGVGTHHDDSLVSVHTQDPVVAGRSACTWVDKNEDIGIDWRGRSYHCEHHLEVAGPEKLLRRVKAKPSQLRLDKVWPIGHNIPQTSMARSRLPPAAKNALLESAWPYQLIFDLEMDNSPRNEV